MTSIEKSKMTRKIRHIDLGRKTHKVLGLAELVKVLCNKGHNHGRSMTPFFLPVPNFCTKFDPLNYFSVRRSSYHLKAEKCKNLSSIRFFQPKMRQKFSVKNWFCQKVFFFWKNVKKGAVFLQGSKLLYKIWPPKLFFRTTTFISF